MTAGDEMLVEKQVEIRFGGQAIALPLPPDKEAVIEWQRVNGAD